MCSVSSASWACDCCGGRRAAWSMTEEGRRLFEATRGALSALETAHETIAERVSEPSGLVRIPGHHRIFASLSCRCSRRCARGIRGFRSSCSRPTASSTPVQREEFDVGDPRRSGGGGPAWSCCDLADVHARDLRRAPLPGSAAALPASVGERPRAHECIAYRSPSTATGRIVQVRNSAATLRRPTSRAPPLTLNDVFAVLMLRRSPATDSSSYRRSSPPRAFTNGDLVPVLVDACRRRRIVSISGTAVDARQGARRRRFSIPGVARPPGPDVRSRRIATAPNVAIAAEPRVSGCGVCRCDCEPEGVLYRRAIAATRRDLGAVAEDDQIFAVQQRAQFAHGADVKLRASGGRGGTADRGGSSSPLSVSLCRYGRSAHRRT